MRFLALALSGCLASSTFVLACGLDEGGASDLIAGDDDGGGGTTTGPDANVNGQADGSTHGDSSLGNDGARDAVAVDTSVNDVVIDTAPPPPDTCSPTEICNNGVDDDCNGKVDCADPACNQWSCANVPTGWTLVEYEPNARDACTNGYASPTPIVEGPSAPPNACACGCTTLQIGTCVTGQFTGDVDGLGSCNVPFSLDAANGACAKFPTSPYKTTGNSKAQVKPAPWTPPAPAGSCSSSATPPAAWNFTAAGEVCGETAPVGGGCGGGAVCAPTASGAFKICIEQTGDVPCPPNGPGANWTKHTVGTGANTPACNACGCSVVGGTCTGAKEDIFTDDSCTTGKVTLTADNKCDDINDNNGDTYNAYQYSAQVTGATCTPSGGGVTQGPALTGVHTVCCGQ